MSEREHVQLPLRILGFEPLYQRVAQTNHWNSAVACIATLVNEPIDEVLHVAVQQFNLPADGRWAPAQKRMPDILAHYDWHIASQFREARTVVDLPDQALILLSKYPDQFALFHRQKFDGGRPPMSYMINPALGIPEEQQFRLDVDAILPCKYLHVCLMGEYMKDFW